MPKIDIAKIPAQQIASYPKEFASVISGREKQKIGDAAGLTQFGVNITRIRAGAASALRHWHEQEDEFIYMLEGELILQENGGETVLKPGDAAGFKAGSGNPIACSIAPPAMRSISRSARGPRASGCTIPTWTS
jgi:uncharacterized cupin superfamily protein